MIRYFLIPTNPIPHLIFNARNTIPPSPSESRGVIEGSLSISFNKEGDSRFHCPKFLFEFRNFSQIDAEQFFKIHKIARRPVGEGGLYALKPCLEARLKINFWFPHY